MSRENSRHFISRATAGSSWIRCFIPWAGWIDEAEHEFDMNLTKKNCRGIIVLFFTVATVKKSKNFSIHIERQVWRKFLPSGIKNISRILPIMNSIRFSMILPTFNKLSVIKIKVWDVSSHLKNIYSMNLLDC